MDQDLPEALRAQKPFAWACIWPDKCGGGAFTTLDETTALNYMDGASKHQPGPKLVPLYASPAPQAAEVGLQQNSTEIEALKRRCGLGSQVAEMTDEQIREVFTANGGQDMSTNIDCRTCTYRTWSGSGQSYDCNAAAGMPLPYSHREGQVPDWCPKEPSLP